jgi:hypothetical protein
VTDATTRYLTLAESNKLLRKCLAAAFPGIKFSIRGDSFSGGSSTSVRWTDGPTEKAVAEIANGFGYKGFDGMIDMSYFYQQWLLADGCTIVCAGTSGTEGSRGSVPGWSIERPPGAVPVSSGIGYISCSREISPAFVQAVAAALARATVEDRCTLLNNAPRRYSPNEDDPAEQARSVAVIVTAPRRSA